MTRTLFDKPIRKCTTESFYPFKISIHDFGSILELDKDHEFLKLKYLQDEERYVEEWTETFLAFCEIEQQ